MINYNKKIPFRDLNQEITLISNQVEKLEIARNFKNFVLYALSELSDNIQEHSKAKNINLRISLDNVICHIEFSDDGIGLKESYISKNIYPKDDSAAIEFALGGLSTKNQQERGFGLYSIRKFLEKSGEKMTIETGLSRATIKEKQISFEEIPPLKGTSIKIESEIKDLNFYDSVE